MAGGTDESETPRNQGGEKTEKKKPPEPSAGDKIDTTTVAKAAEERRISTL